MQKPPQCQWKVVCWKEGPDGRCGGDVCKEIEVVQCPWPDGWIPESWHKGHTHHPVRPTQQFDHSACCTHEDQRKQGYKGTCLCQPP